METDYSYTNYWLKEFEENKETLESLRQAKSRYEGGNVGLTEGITMTSPVGQTIKGCYDGLCEAIAILEAQSS